MKRIKFLIFLMLSFGLLICLCSCGSNKPSKSGKYTPSTPGVKEIVSIDANYDGEINPGGYLDIEFLSVIAIYSDDSIQDIKNECNYYIDSSIINFSSYIFNEPGNIRVNVEYADFEDYFIVTVNSNYSSLKEVYLETKEVFDHAGKYDIIFDYQFNGLNQKASMTKVQDGLYHFSSAWDIKGTVTFTAKNGYSTVINQISTSTSSIGNMFVIDSLTSGHWTSYTKNYEPIRAVSLTASYEDAEVEQYAVIDFDKVNVIVNCSDNTQIAVKDYKLYYMKDYNTKVYIDSKYSFGENIGDEKKIYVEGYDLTTSFKVTIIAVTYTETVYLNALCGFDYPDSPHKDGFGIYVFFGEDGNEKMYKMEKVGSFSHIYYAEVKRKSTEAFYVSFKVAMMYSNIAHQYLFTGYKTNKMYMSSNYNMFGVAEIGDDLIAHGQIHKFDSNFDYDNDIIYDVSYDGWLSKLRGNLTYRQRIYDNRLQTLFNDQIYYQNGENERRIDRYDGDGNIIDNYYIRTIYNRRYMYFIDGDIRRIEDVEDESWWWSGSDKVRYKINLSDTYVSSGFNISYSESDILNYISDPENYHYGHSNSSSNVYFIKFENYQLKEIWFIDGDNVFCMSDFKDWDTTEPEPLEISFNFYIRTNWYNVAYTIYNQEDEVVASGYTDDYYQYSNYPLSVSQTYNELDVFGDSNQYYYVIFSTTNSNGLGESKTTDAYYLNNVLGGNNSDRTKAYTLDDVKISISNDGVVEECTLPLSI